MEHFKQEITMLGFLKEKPGYKEKILNYFKRMEKMGKKLKLKEANIFDIIRNNLRQNGFQIKTIIAGNRKFNENLYEKIKDFDILIEEKEKVYSKKKKEEKKREITLRLMINGSQ